MFPHPVDFCFPPNKLPLYWVHCGLIFALFNFLLSGIAWRYSWLWIPNKYKFTKQYRSYYFGIIFCSNLPWLLMEAGILTGQVGSIINFGVFWEGNPIAIAWWEIVAILSIAGYLWLHLGGAEVLAQYPRLPMVPIGDVEKIKKFTIPSILSFPLFFILLQSIKGLIPFVAYHREWMIRIFIIAVIYIFSFVFVYGWLISQSTDWSAWATHYRTKNKFKGSSTWSPGAPA